MQPTLIEAFVYRPWSVSQSPGLSTRSHSCAFFIGHSSLSNIYFRFSIKPFLNQARKFSFISSKVCSTSCQLTASNRHSFWKKKIMVSSRLYRGVLSLTTFILLLLSVSACSAHSARLSANTFHEAREAHKSVHTHSKRTPLRYGRATLYGMSSGLSDRAIHANYGTRMSDTQMARQNNPQSRSLSNPSLESFQLVSASGDDCKVQFKGEEIAFKGCSGQLERDFKIFYSKNDTHIDTLFRVPESTGNYAALGWGCSSMFPCYAMVASVFGEPTLASYHLTDHSKAGVTRADAPVTDTDISFEDGVIMARFTRPLKSSTPDFPSLSGDSFDFIWALGEFRSDGPQQHDNDARGDSELNLVDGAVSAGGNATRFQIAHAVLMSLSWLLFAPIAVIAIRFFKKYNPITFRIHMSLAITTMLCTIIAVLLVIFKASHTRTNHMGVGYTVLTLVVIQVVGGLLRPDKSASVRAYWILLHRILGPVAILLAFINIIIGIYVIKGSGFWYAVVALAFLAHITAALFFATFKRKFPTVQTERKASQSHAPSDPAEDSLVI